MTSSERRGLTPRASFVLLGLLAAGCGGSEGDDPPAETGKQDPSADEIAYLVGPTEGRWHAPRTHQFDDGLTDEQREAIAELEGLGYADGLHDAPVLKGVLRHDRERALQSTNLYTSAHKASAMLMDMDGKVLHEWAYGLREAWPNHPQVGKLGTFWRRTHLFENGDLIAIFEGLGIIKVDKDSNLLWASRVRAHHDLDFTPKGNILVLTREAHMIPEISTERPVLEDFIAELDAKTGRQIRRVSLIKAMRGSEFEEDWGQRIHLGGDLFHTNSLERLDGRIADKNPAFRDGNMMVSMLLLDLVAVFDLEQQRITWGKQGPWKLQHDPQVLDSNTVMVFDNKGGGPESSRVLEFDPATWEIVWSYQGTEDEPFYSETCGLAQRLPNGNTLITESDFGRAFEVTREGDVVWEWMNPHRAGTNEEYIATLMEMVRLPVDFPLDWVDESK